MTQTETGGRNVLAELDRRVPTRFYWQLTLLACLGGFLFGYDTSNIGAALNFVPYHLSSFWTGYLVAGASLGAAAGAICAGPIADRFGRKALLITDALIYAVGAILSAVTPNAAVLLIARTLIGLAIGADSAIATAYIAEYAPRDRRGALSMLQQWMITVGILVSYVDRAHHPQGGAGQRGHHGLAAHPRHRRGPGADRAGAADQDAGVATVADAARQVRGRPGRAGQLRHRGLAAGRGVHRPAAGGGRPARAAAHQVDRGGTPRAVRGLRVLHLPADHRHQRPALLRPAPARPAVPGQQLDGGQDHLRGRGHPHAHRGQRGRHLFRVPLDRPEGPPQAGHRRLYRHGPVRPGGRGWAGPTSPGPRGSWS